MQVARLDQYGQDPWVGTGYWYVDRRGGFTMYRDTCAAPNGPMSPSWGQRFSASSSTLTLMNSDGVLQTYTKE
jgi:hypothetical protein